MSDDTLSEEAIEKINDLKIQAMMFDFDIDWETLGLVPKSIYKDAIWVERYKEKRDQSDFNELFDIDWE